jgi:hypothetical protein
LNEKFKVLDEEFQHNVMDFKLCCEADANSNLDYVEKILIQIEDEKEMRNKMMMFVFNNN